MFKNKITFIIWGLLLTIAGVFLSMIMRQPMASLEEQVGLHSEDVDVEVAPEVIVPEEILGESFAQPLESCASRVTKKPFGIYITPSNSPVQPERFEGFHAGVDFEVSSGELNQEVYVHAICEGEIIMQRRVSGYGGVVVESCESDGEPITVLYGHLNLASVIHVVGNVVEAGDVIGSLGKANSPETDNERKHLHLSIKKGLAIDVRGYVQEESDLLNWINPLQYVCQDEK